MSGVSLFNILDCCVADSRDLDEVSMGFQLLCRTLAYTRAMLFNLSDIYVSKNIAKTKEVHNCRNWIILIIWNNFALFDVLGFHEKFAGWTRVAVLFIGTVETVVLAFLTTLFRVVIEVAIVALLAFAIFFAN